MKSAMLHCCCPDLLQCATAEGRVGMSFCGPILSAVGFFWWIAFAASATSAAGGAAHWDQPGFSLQQYRTGERQRVLIDSLTTEFAFHCMLWLSLGTVITGRLHRHAVAP